MSPERLAAEVGYGESLAKYLADAEKLRGLKAHAGDEPQTVTLSALRKRVDAIDAAELKQSQDCCVVIGDYIALAEARVPELATVAETRGEEMKATEERVTKALNEAGVSVQSQKGWPDNPPAAAIQFGLQVKQSADWRTANQKLNTARANHQAAVEEVANGRAQLVKAQAALAATVKRLAGI